MSPSVEDRPTFLNGDSNTEETRSVSSKVQDERTIEEHHLDEEQQQHVHQLLARQLEYYFSTANLEKDTYVSTLRSLNDGYVPVSIIANFAKVQSLAPMESALPAVQTAACEFSELLEIVMVDSETGKRVQSDDGASPSSAKLVMAVGPVSGEPIPLNQPNINSGAMEENVTTPAPVKGMSTTFSSMPGSSSNGVQNTIILRETPDGVTEKNVRELFLFEGCPAIEEIHLDLQNCWFVTLDTSSRDAMVDVMFKLRSKTFPSGEPVKSRLKSSAITNVSPSPFPIIPGSAPSFDPAQMMTMFAPELSAGNQNNSAVGKKKQNKGRRSKRKGQHKQQQANHSNKQNGQASTNNCAAQGKRPEGKHQTPSQFTLSSAKPKVEEKRQSPPKLGEDVFPQLPSAEEIQTNKIEVEKVPDARSDADDDEFEKHRNGGFSDSSSTVTTSTSSTPSPSQPHFAVVMGGYAAAARKPPAPVPVVKKIQPKADPKTSSFRGKLGIKMTEKRKDIDDAHPPVNVQPPSWGGGRSFADILRAKDASNADPAKQQAV